MRDAEQQQENGSDTDGDDAGRGQGEEGKGDDGDECCHQVGEEHPERLYERVPPVITGVRSSKAVSTLSKSAG